MSHVYSLVHKVNDVPGRLVLQLAPGKHIFKNEFGPDFDAIIEAGKSYVVPIWPHAFYCTGGYPGYCSAQGQSGFVVYPMQPPPGC